MNENNKQSNPVKPDPKEFLAHLKQTRRALTKLTEAVRLLHSKKKTVPQSE
jgi:hypothetical protein